MDSLKFYSSEWNKTLKDFSDEVANKKYKKSDYDVWRYLKSFYNVEVSFKNNKVYINNDVVFSSDDNSLGQFLTDLMKKKSDNISVSNDTWQYLIKLFSDCVASGEYLKVPNEYWVSLKNITSNIEIIFSDEEVFITTDDYADAQRFDKDDNSFGEFLATYYGRKIKKIVLGPKDWNNLLDTFSSCKDYEPLSNSVLESFRKFEETKISFSVRSVHIYSGGKGGYSCFHKTDNSFGQFLTSYYKKEIPEKEETLSNTGWYSLFSEFNAAVAEKKYKDINYKVLHDFLNYKGDVIITFYKNRVYIINSGLQKVFFKNDKSFGEFLATSFCMTINNIKFYGKKISIDTENNKKDDKMTLNNMTVSDSYTATASTVNYNNISTGVLSNSATVPVNYLTTVNQYDGKENNKKMKMFNGFEFGKVDGSSVHMSMYGLAVKNASGAWVSYDTKNKEIIDVDVFNFNGDQFLYKIPVALDAVHEGDVVVHARKPMIVTGVSEKELSVIDVVAGEIKAILPTRNMFGFNFVTKIVSIVDMMGDNKPDASNPFGNMWMLALMNDSAASNKDIMMMMALSGKMDMKNPMMMYALMGDNKDIDPMMLMLMSGAFSPAT